MARDKVEKPQSLGKTLYAAADRLKNAVENNFFNGKSYDYLYNESSAQEGLGLSFLLLFDIVTKDRAEGVIKNVYVTKIRYSVRLSEFSAL